jgi:hypothetical protein
MITRRDFMKVSAGAAGILAASKFSFAKSGQFPLGVQLYTVRQQAEQDLGAVLAHISMIGYTEVETYWNVYTHPAKKLRTMIVDNGLSVPSGHFDYDGLEAKLDYAKELGVQYIQHLGRADPEAGDAVRIPQSQLRVPEVRQYDRL